MSVLLNLKELRNERGISQQKLAEAIGMGQSSINDYENRGIEPDIGTLIRIADYFETSVDYLVAHTHIRCRLEETSEFTLNEREIALVNGYRSIPASGRLVIDDMIAELKKGKSAQ